MRVPSIHPGKDIEAQASYDGLGPVGRWRLRNGLLMQPVGHGRFLYWCPRHQAPHFVRPHGRDNRLRCDSL